jgi:4-amino-4-deoxy-L-arabinose transferase-like glycosyltransferase
MSLEISDAVEPKGALAPADSPPSAEDGSEDDAGHSHSLARSDEEPTSLGPEPRFGPWPAWAPAALVAALGVLLFALLPPLSRSGIWDPYELQVADLSRRIGVNLHGAAHLALSETDNTLPHLNDLGRPQLPFTSVALGMKFFGLHDWAGRLPLALWGVILLLATYTVVARLSSKRSGVYSAVALACMPLVLVQSRTMLGDIVTMAALAMACGGGLLLLLGKAQDRSIGAVMGALGLLAGYYSRGVALGLVVPLATVGLTGLLRQSVYFADIVPPSGSSWVWRLPMLLPLRTIRKLLQGDPSPREREALVTMLVTMATLGSAAFLLRGVAFHLLRSEVGRDMDVWLGGMPRSVGTAFPTFDVFYGYVGHGMAPWSALVPLAIGRAFAAPVAASSSKSTSVEQAQHDTVASSSGLRAAMIVGGTLTLVMQTVLLQRTDVIPFVGPFFFAVLIGVMLSDYEEGAHPSLALAVIGVLFLGLFHHDYHAIPEKVYTAFGVTGVTFPEVFKERSYLVWTIVLVGMAGVLIATFAEGRPKREPFSVERYAKIYRQLRDGWDGTFAWLYLAGIALGSLAGIGLWLGQRFRPLWVAGLSPNARLAASVGWWVALLVPPLVVFGTLFALDVIHWAFSRSEALDASSFTRGLQIYERTFLRAKAEYKRWSGERETLEAESDEEKGANEQPYRESQSKAGNEPMEDAQVEESDFVAACLLLTLTVVPLPALVFYGAYKTQGIALALVAALAIGPVAYCVLGLIGDLVRGSRAALIPVCGLAFVLVQSLMFFPALANQMSPKDCFATFQTSAKTGDELALYGVGGKTAAYYAGGSPQTFTQTQPAFEWLVSAREGNRRFLASRSEELALLNQLYRRVSRGRENLPVLDGRSSQILLLASSLKEGELNQNPLNKIVYSTETAPKPQRPLNVNFDDKLQCLGYDLTDANGRLVDAAGQSRAHRLRFFYKVLAPMTSDWQAFIHIDGHQRRQNGDHRVCKEKYPMTRWNVDDVVIDEYEFTMDPKFTAGDYVMYFGFFVGDTRLKIKSGSNDNDSRANGGIFRVK